MVIKQKQNLKQILWCKLSKTNSIQTNLIFTTIKDVQNQFFNNSHQPVTKYKLYDQ